VLHCFVRGATESIPESISILELTSVVLFPTVSEAILCISPPEGSSRTPPGGISREEPAPLTYGSPDRPGNALDLYMLGWCTMTPRYSLPIADYSTGKRPTFERLRKDMETNCRCCTRGERTEIYRAEFHDIGMAANLFGRVYMTNMLMQCRNLVHNPQTTCPSRNCEVRDKVYRSNFNGFQWYDVSRRFFEMSL
jgi:hypothetical protein